MRIIFLILLFLSSVNATLAADYFVFKVAGDARVVRNERTIILKEKMTLNDKDIIYLGEKSSITLTNQKKKKVIILKKPCQGKVKNLIGGKSSFAEVLRPVRSFFNYISGLCSSDFINEQNEVLRGVSERGDPQKAQEEEKNLKLVLEIIKLSQPG